MEDRTAHPPATSASREPDRATPDIALRRLEEGNARFVAARTVARDWPSEVRAGSDRQQPFAFVLGCIDSRVPVEVIFDQGVGDLFTARVAGNVLNDDLLGSMEFACGIMGASVVLVLGHTSCGAVEGAIAGVELGHLSGLLRKIQTSVEAERAVSAMDAEGFSDRVAERHLRAVVASVRDRSPVLAEMEGAGKVMLCGAMYDVGTGKVRFL